MNVRIDGTVEVLSNSSEAAWEQVWNTAFGCMQPSSEAAWEQVWNTAFMQPTQDA